MKRTSTHIYWLVRSSMKRVLFSLLIVLFAKSSFACIDSLRCAPAPYDDVLLQYSFTNLTIYTGPYTPTTGSFVRVTFGDGGFANFAYPYSGTKYHTYADTGLYTVHLINYVFDTSGGSTPYCVKDDSQTIHVLYPTLGFTTSHTYLPARTVIFQANCFAKLTGMAYHWNFGDGSPARITSLDTIWHTYPSDNTYYITVYDSMLLNRYNNRDTVYIFSPATSLSGYIFRDTLIAPTAAIYKIWLLSYDSLLHTINAVDSDTVNSNLYQTTYQFTNQPAGKYLVKVVVMNAGISGSGFVPTYYGDATSWSNASLINWDTGSVTSINMTMQHGTITFGAGFIAGNVRYMVNGNPVVGELMMLRDAGNKLLAYTVTNAAGHYSFSNLPFGKYTVYPEAEGYIIVSYGGITLMPTTPGVFDVNFKQSTTTIVPDGLTGIAKINNKDAFTIAPNPCKGKVAVSWGSSLRSDVNITVLNTLGQKVYTTVIQAARVDHAELDLEKLQPGVYFMSVDYEGNNYNTKLIVQ